MFQHWQHFQASDYSDWQMGILNLTDPQEQRRGAVNGGFALLESTVQMKKQEHY